jgi:Fe-S oxidoreductase
MWMEEKIGKSINVERTDEALGLDPDIVSTACPFCMVMLSDAVTAKQQSGGRPRTACRCSTSRRSSRGRSSPAAGARRGRCR